MLRLRIQNKGSTIVMSGATQEPFKSEEKEDEVSENFKINDCLGILLHVYDVC